MVDTTSARVVKLTVNIRREHYQTLEKLASHRGLSVTEALHHALDLYTFVDQTLANHETFLIQSLDRRLRHVYFEQL